MGAIAKKLQSFLSSTFRSSKVPDPALASPIGKKVRRFLSNTYEREDRYFLDLGGTYLEIWFRGWSESYDTPRKTIELELPLYISGQTIVRLRAYDFPENGTIVSFANGAALQIYLPPFIDGGVYTGYDFYEPLAVGELESRLVEVGDPILREEPPLGEKTG